MTDLKAGDRVKVEFEGTVTYENEKTVRVTPDSDGYEFAWVTPERLTKIASGLPTKRGGVIESHGYRFMLTAGGWIGHVDARLWDEEFQPFQESMYARDFTVLLEG